jgi:hypothetical protein
MSSMSWLFANGAESLRPITASELITAQRARRAVEEDERAQLRLAQLAEQRADSNPPDVRIRVWEKLHGLRLPSDSSHPVLELIAIGTRLTLAQVQAEQRVRQARSALQPAEHDVSSLPTA